MLKLKTRVVAFARTASNNNNDSSCRKRMSSDRDIGACDLPELATPDPAIKRTKFTGITSCDGVWDPKQSKFAKKKRGATSTPGPSSALTSTPRNSSPPNPKNSVSSIESDGYEQPASPSGGAAGRTGREGTPPPPQVMHSTQNASTPNSAQIDELKSDESDEELLLAACEMNENTDNETETEVDEEMEVPNENENNRSENEDSNADHSADQSADPLEGSGNSVLLKAMDETRSACENYW